MVKKIMVIGAGQMGSGIAQVFAQAKYEVILNDLNEEVLQKSKANIEKHLARSVEKNRMSQNEKSATIDRLTYSTNLQSAEDCDFIIEAIVEDLEVKKSIFKQLDDIAKQKAIFATNTSSISITELAAGTKRADQVIGMHFMNPVPVMKLVEIIRGLQTSDETYTVVKELSDNLSKVSVEVNDFPGFAANRILMPLINEAIYAVYEGVSSIEDVDTVMKLGMNHPMGPLELADFIGLDTCLSIIEVLHEGLGDSKYRPCPLLKQYVQAGWYGKKTNKGFYEYK